MAAHEHNNRMNPKKKKTRTNICYIKSTSLGASFPQSPLHFDIFSEPWKQFVSSLQDLIRTDICLRDKLQVNLIIYLFIY